MDRFHKRIGIDDPESSLQNQRSSTTSSLLSSVEQPSQPREGSRESGPHIATSMSVRNAPRPPLHTERYAGFRSAESTLEEELMQPLPPRRASLCQCCYGDMIVDSNSRLAKCSTGRHHFCSDCIRRYVESFVYGEPYLLRDGVTDDGFVFKVLPCLASDCTEGYLSHELIQRTSKMEVWEAYQEKIFHIAALEDQIHDKSSWEAPEVPPPAASSAAISPEERVIHHVEEAMTEAKLRRCPVCRTPFLKEAGYCNKMRCPCCRTCVCYICGQRVPTKGYDHFCIHNDDVCSKKCGKCVLWTNHDDVHDQERLRTIATTEANRAWEESLLQDQVPAAQVDIVRLLYDPSKADAKKKALVRGKNIMKVKLCQFMGWRKKNLDP